MHTEREQQLPTHGTVEIPDRLTVTESVYHQPPDRDPFQHTSGFERRLKSTEQVYQRHYTVTDQWQPLDHGWIETCSLLIVANVESFRGAQLQPTDEERRELAKRIVEVGGPDCAWLVPPGESMRGCAADLEKVLIRSQHGPARVTVTIVPE